MRVAIIGNNKCWHAGRLTAALQSKGIGTDNFLPQMFRASVGGSSGITVRGLALDGYDIVLVRSLPGGSLEQVIFRVDVLHHLEDMGVPVINRPSCIEKTVDKYYTSALLAAGGIPTPKTVVTENYNTAMSVFSEMKDVIVKPLFGSLGLGIVRLTDEDTAHRVFRAWQSCNYVFYIQEYIPHNNRDIRAFVLGSRVIASMQRLGDGWKTNINRGARAESMVIGPALEELCLKTANILGADYLGVDILVSNEGKPYVIEANSIPGWKGLQETTNLDIALEIADFVIAKGGLAASG